MQRKDYILLQLDIQEEQYSTLFPIDSIVYLTPDSNEPLNDIDEDKVYVIGGLVDESVTKVRYYTVIWALSSGLPFMTSCGQMQPVHLQR